jgi:RHS repeat-associated protein
LFVIDYADGLKRPLAETDASGNITRYYVWSGSHLPCHIEADGTTRYYHADELGSTLALTDETGVVTDEFAYMPYGTATHSGSTETPFQWLGGYGVYYDSTTDLHLTLHRAYSSSMKRFISPDPLGIDGGKNVYMWANMNPLFFVDPYGLCAGEYDWDDMEWWDKLGGGYYYGTGAGLESQQWYMDQIVNNGKPWYQEMHLWAGGFMAGLWTPDTYQETGWTLISAYGLRNAGNLKFDGRSGTRRFQVRDSQTGKPYFRADKGPVPGKGNNRWHYHRRPDLRKHRPFEGL